jgi:hypothetical protein
MYSLDFHYRKIRTESLMNFQNLRINYPKLLNLEYIFSTISM